MDNSKSFNIGQKREREFFDFLKDRGFRVRKDKTLEFDHIDGYIFLGENEYSFDFKARKKRNRYGKYLEDYTTWVELKNVRGENGWLYGKADYIVFEQSYFYLFILRKNLIKLINKKVDLTDSSNKKQLYTLYSRQGREDLITLVDLKDVDVDFRVDKQ